MRLREAEQTAFKKLGFFVSDDLGIFCVLVDAGCSRL